jgi:hypothetical protein
MTELPTARDYAGIHAVHAICLRCDRVVALDLAAVIAAGQGDIPLVRLPLRCSACGRSETKISVSGRSYASKSRP